MTPETLKEILRELPSHLIGCVQAQLRERGDRDSELDATLQIALMKHALVYLRSVGSGGGPIVPLPQHLVDLVIASNRIVSFVLDGKTHFASGILVGPNYVLTAAHLFFERTRKLIDRARLGRISAEVHSTLLDGVIMEGEVSSSPLADTVTNDWLLDPTLDQYDVAERDVEDLDFVIVKLRDNLGDETVGGDKRGWFDIPTTETAEVLTANLGLRVLQFLDRGPLLASTGFVHQVSPDGLRVLHTASTADSASGALVISDRGNLVAIHVSGSASGERPKYNRAIPIRRIAEVIDRSSGQPLTVRARMKS